MSSKLLVETVSWKPCRGNRVVQIIWNPSGAGNDFLKFSEKFRQNSF